MEELFTRLEMIRLEISLMNDALDKEDIDIEKLPAKMKKICKRLSDLRDEYEVEDFLLFGNGKQ